MAGSDKTVSSLGRAAAQAQDAQMRAGAPRRRRTFGMQESVDVFACVFAVTLCLANALVWAFVSGMPFVGIAWVGAAVLCVRVQKWARD